MSCHPPIYFRYMMPLCKKIRVRAGLDLHPLHFAVATPRLLSDQWHSPLILLFFFLNKKKKKKEGTKRDDLLALTAARFRPFKCSPLAELEHSNAKKCHQRFPFLRKSWPSQRMLVSRGTALSCIQQLSQWLPGPLIGDCTLNVTARTEIQCERQITAVWWCVSSSTYSCLPPSRAEIDNGVTSQRIFFPLTTFLFIFKFMEEHLENFFLRRKHCRERKTELNLLEVDKFSTRVQ